MRLFLLFVLVVVNTFVVKAQMRWSSGVIVLKDATVLVGDVQFHSDVLLFKENEITIVYPAHQISSFRYYDERANINRHYLSLSDPRFIFPVLHFFEVVTWGEVSVVRRDHHPLLTGTKDEADYTYYSLNNDELISLKKFRTRTYEGLLEKYPLLLKEYVASERLNPNQTADAIRIIKFYNKQTYTRASIAAL